MLPSPRLRGLLALVLLLLAAPAFAQAPTAEADQAPEPVDLVDQDVMERYQATITPEELSAYLYFYASDFFEGRETTTRGQKMAAHYLASQYRKLGLAPKGTAETDDPRAPEAYLQPFPVYSRTLDQATLTHVQGADTVGTYAYGPDAQEGFYLAFGSRASTAGGVVFAGYGIDSEDNLGYSDYQALEEADIDVKGKWVVILRDEPMAADSTSLLTDDGARSRWSANPVTKYRPALFRNARGLLVVGDTGPMGADVTARAAERAAALGEVESLALEPATGGNGSGYPPFYFVSSDLADALLAPQGVTVAEAQAQIDAQKTPYVFEVEGTTLGSELSFSSQELQTENVLAFLEGSDPDLKDEVVVLSSHYDHIGLEPAGTEGDTINNGADDDGSGNVTMLEIAEAFAKAKAAGHGPRRSILFLSVSGEEKGLLGSEYYADQEPVLPLEQTVANLNVDMIGRHDPSREGSTEYVYIIGGQLISDDLHAVNTTVNDATGLGLALDQRFNTREDPNQFYRRSDHANFGKHGVPFIFYFTGTHPDYHQPSDEAYKIDYDRMARIGRLIFGTAWQVANQDARPEVSARDLF